MAVQMRKIIIALLLSVAGFSVAIIFYPMVQSLLIASIVLMVVLWTNEGLPLAAVSLLPIVIYPAAGILTTKETTLNYANPIVFLFLGGFLLAIAVEKTGLHRWIANKMLNLFPGSARGIVFALIFTSGLLSSVLSNTTTTLLLLPIVLYLVDDNKLKLRFSLGVAYGASIGGILTPIGTPPNLILMGLMQEWGLEPISFVQWVWMVAPLVLLMSVIVGFVLSFDLKQISIKHDLSTSSLNTSQKKVLAVFSGLILLLLMNAPVKPYYDGLGLNETGILLAAGLMLFVPPLSILDWNQDKNNIPYQIMFLFGAGFTIAAAFTQTGMAKEVASQLIALVDMPTVIFMLVVALIVTFTTEITSNTALISIMLPILYQVVNAAGLNVTLFMMIATICASYAFMLPIATPPNAIVMSSGAVSVRSMAGFGFIINIIGILLIVMVAQLIWSNVL